MDRFIFRYCFVLYIQPAERERERESKVNDGTVQFLSLLLSLMPSPSASSPSTSLSLINSISLSFPNHNSTGKSNTLGIHSPVMNVILIHLCMHDQVGL